VDVVGFPIGINSMSPENRKALKSLASKLWIELEKNKKRVIYEKKSGVTAYDQYWPEYSVLQADF
jgi:hypothetical protein